MNNKKTYFNLTAILFIIAAGMVYYLWRSWCLYYAALIVAYVALMLLTAIIKGRLITESDPSEQFSKAKIKLYDTALDNYTLVCVFSMFFSLIVADTSLWGILMIFANVGIAVIAFMFAVRWCEHKDWWRWFHKIVLEQS